MWLCAFAPASAFLMLGMVANSQHVEALSSLGLLGHHASDVSSYVSGLSIAIKGILVFSFLLNTAATWTIISRTAVAGLALHKWVTLFNALTQFRKFGNYILQLLRT